MCARFLKGCACYGKLVVTRVRKGRGGGGRGGDDRFGSPCSEGKGIKESGVNRGWWVFNKGWVRRWENFDV